MILTDKEKSLLKELAVQEKTCAKKYLNASRAAFDPQLKNLFSSLSQAEQQHLEMINSILSGTLPQVQAGGGETAFTAVYTGSETQQKLEDAFLCTDLLAAEKYASREYDTRVFEFGDAGVRNILGAIQRQEQGHGKSISDYMKVNAMCTAA
mgnify:FL=1